MMCKICGGEVLKPKGSKNRNKVAVPEQELCVKCRLSKLGWKDVKEVKETSHS